MRALASLFAFALSVGAVGAQTQSTVAVVKVGSVSVRCGPSEQMAVCGTLEQGAEVIAHHAKGTDWYAIQPPAGSLSWISQLNVELKRKPGEAADTFPVDAVVNALDSGEVKIAAGMMGERKPLNVQRTKLPSGTLVRIVGPKVKIDGDDSQTGWYPILPPRDDFRYVPKSALELAGRNEKVNFVVKGQTEVKPSAPEGNPAAALPGPTPPRSTTEVNGDWPNNQLWRDAERARADGNYAKAEELYLQLATASNKAGDVKLANLCYERIHTVREQSRTKSTSGSLRPMDDPKTPPIVNVKSEGKSVIGDGILRTVRFEYQNRKVYALTGSKGEVRLYLIADGIELERYVGKWLEIAGTVAYPKEFGGDGLLTGTRIETVK